MKKLFKFIPAGIIVMMMFSALVIGATLNQGEKQLLVDGDMENVGVGDWAGVTDATLSKQAGGAEGGSQILRITATAQAGLQYPQTSQTPPLTIGKTYRYTGWARSDGTEVPAITASTGVWSGGTSGNWEYFDVTHTATTTSMAFSFSVTDPDGSEYVEWDDILVTEFLPPNKNAEGQILVDGDMENVGVGDWVAVTSTLTKETGAVYDGSQILRVLNNSSLGEARQAILTNGQEYRVTGWRRTDGVATGRIILQATNLGDFTNSSWEHIDMVGVSTGTDFRLIKLDLGGDYVEFDDVLITEYAPPLKNSYSQLLVDGDMEVPEVLGSEEIVGGMTLGGWTVGNSATLTNPSADVLRVAYNGVANPEAYQTILTIGKTYRAKEITDGGVSDWPILINGTITKEAGSPNGDGSQVLRIAYSDTGNPTVSQAVITSGKTYRITGFGRGDNTVNPYIKTGASVVIWSGSSSENWQYFDETFISDSTTLFFRMIGSSGYVEFDDVFITESK